MNKKLYEDKTWLRLLHFKKSPFNATNQSDIISPSFFLSYNKKTTKNISAKEELIATLKAFYTTLDRPKVNITKSANSKTIPHAVCRFPARLLWLKKKLKIDISEIRNLNQCKNFQQWAKIDSLDSVSLILVSGFFGNPASTFGHSLIKINNSEYKLNSGNLLDQSINYGAQIPDNEPTLIYIAKGIFGKYLSAFSDKKFYAHDQIYSKNEFRDMWEYQLNLSHEQKLFFVYHIWEMLGQDAAYFFLKENCAYRIAEIVEMVTNSSITPNLQPWYLPLTLFQNLEEIEKGRYIKNINYLPSSQRKLYHKINQLTKIELNTFTLSLTKPDKTNNVLKPLSIEQKIHVINALLDYYQYKVASASDDKHQEKIWSKKKHKLVLARLSLPMLKNKSTQVPIIKSPAKGPRSKLFSIGLKETKQHKSLIEVGVSAVHYDLLSNTKGSLENSELKVLALKLQLNKKQKKVFLKSLDLISIRKMALIETKLRDEDTLSWVIKIGFEQDDRCEQCIGFMFQGGIGKAKKISTETFAYGLIEGKISTSQNKKLQIIPNIGITTRWTNVLKTNAGIAKVFNTETGEKNTTYELEARYKLSRNNSIRLSYKKSIFENNMNKSNTLISFNHYW